MKALFFHPQINARHSLAKALQDKGVTCLYATTLDEALLLLSTHGKSIDFAFVHREGSRPEDKEPGLRFIEKTRNDPEQSDLPVILTSGIWTEDEFYKHQQGPHGVNAYMAAPFKDKAVLDRIEAVLGEPLGTAAPTPVPAAQAIELTPELPAAIGGPMLEDPSDIYEKHSGSIPTAAHESIQLAEPSIPTAASLSMAEPLLEAGGSFPEPAAPLHLDLPISPPPAMENAEPSIDLRPSADELPLVAPGEPLSISIQASALDDHQADAEAASALPYLFNGTRDQRRAPYVHAQPIGDAVVPGGAAHAPDLETLKKYLLLREQDVAVLTSQLQLMKERLNTVETEAHEFRVRNELLESQSQDQAKRIEGFDREKRVMAEAQESELSELRFRVKEKSEKSRNLELQLEKSTEELERIRERVKVDIRKIRAREKELENKLEITRRDAEAVIAAREVKILELKRKLDMLEFNADLLQAQVAKEKDQNTRLKDRLSRVSQIVRVAGGMLDPVAPTAGPAKASERHELSLAELTPASSQTGHSDLEFQDRDPGPGPKKKAS